MISPVRLLTQIERYEQIFERLSKLPKETIERLPPSTGFDNYQQVLADYIHFTEIKFDRERDSFRHWLEPGASHLRLALETDEKKRTVTLQIHADRALVKFARARQAAVRAESLSYTMGDAYLSDPRKSHDRTRQRLIDKLGDKANPLLRQLRSTPATNR